MTNVYWMLPQFWIVYIIEIITAGGRGEAVTRTGFLPAPGRDQRVRADNYPPDERRDKWQIDNFNELHSSWASQILQLFHTPIVWITIYIKPLLFCHCLPLKCRSTPLSSQPYFPKVRVHGKFQYRVSREGLGTSEMWKTKTTDEPFWRSGIWGI